MHLATAWANELYALARRFSIFGILILTKHYVIGDMSGNSQRKCMILST